MFQKVHFRLTCLCAVITICILCLFSGLYLYLSERTLTENHRLSFQHDMDSLCISLEQQTVITFQYLNTMEQNGRYYIYLWDRETPYYFNSISHHASSQETAQLALELYQKQEAGLSAGSDTRYQIFQLTGADGVSYDVCGASLISGQLSAAQNLTARNEQQGLTLLVLYPRTFFLRQLWQQRFSFLLLSLSGCILLTLFAWFFTGRLLLPIRENQKRQIQFVADASHELRTPLAVIRSCISVQPPNYKETIQQECIRMGHLIEDMLTLTGLESQQLPLRLQETEPDTLLLDTYESMEVLAREKGLRLSISLPELPLPRLQADSDKLKQLLMILLQNSFRYTPEGGAIILKGDYRASHLIFQVIDNGCGISDKDKSHIFERFYRAQVSHTDKGHFGLGLCIAREIALAHHGSLQVSDTPGGGTTFTCELPL